MTRLLGAFAALCLLGPFRGLVRDQEALHPFPRRHLQSGDAGTVVYVEKTAGAAILEKQEDGAALVVSISSA